MSCSEDAELRRGHQPLGGSEASFGGFDGVLDLVGGDGVVVAWIGILGLVSASAESVDGLESADAGELRVDRFDDHDVAAGGGGAQTLVGEERGGGLACRVVGERERALRDRQRLSSTPR